MPVDKSKIEWTDSTWLPVTGCTKVSPGCKFCFAERVAKRYWGARKFTDVQVHADRLDQPLRWRRPRRVFVNSMSDLFHEKVSVAFLAEVFDVMAAAERHTFQILTKRPDRMLAAMRDDVPHYAATTMAGDTALSTVLEIGEWPLPNVWMGVSVEDQARADERIPLLLQTPAAVRFLSVEPLLGPVTIPTVHSFGDQRWDGPRIDWVILGGESGGPSERALVTKGRTYSDRAPFFAWRPKDEALDWVRSLRDQCVAAGVPFFFKAWGGPTSKSGGRQLDGKTWDEYPC